MEGQGVEARLLAPTLSHITINAGHVLSVLQKATQKYFFAINQGKRDNS